MQAQCKHAPLDDGKDCGVGEGCQSKGVRNIEAAKIGAPRADQINHCRVRGREHHGVVKHGGVDGVDCAGLQKQIKGIHARVFPIQHGIGQMERREHEGVDVSGHGKKAGNIAAISDAPYAGMHAGLSSFLKLDREHGILHFASDGQGDAPVESDFVKSIDVGDGGKSAIEAPFNATGEQVGNVHVLGACSQRRG